MYIRVLGAAAGGGYPQWNCNHPNSRLARSKDPVAIGLFSQKELHEALEKAERRIKREKKQKEKDKLIKQ